ncbi:MAG: FAD/NAD(P)-binding protein [Gemmatimonadetes bacterium]|nr:FAD/NAD(P)-binding protein [Gemmatimonadota bacterium]
MLEWLIIGGGIHGVHLAHALVHRKKWRADTIRILDPHPALLHVWCRQTATTGMTFLRSPAAHHIGLTSSDLRTFAGTAPVRSFAQFALPHRRPSLRLFNHHARQIIRTHNLHTLHIQNRATGFSFQDNRICVDTQTGRLDARRVLLATGPGEHLAWPDWAALHRNNCRVHHIFDPDFHRNNLADWQHAVVIGAGLSASQIALTLARQRPGAVTLLSRTTPSVDQFDIDPGWMAPKSLTRLHREQNYVKRRNMIRGGRHRGSITPNEAVELRLARKRGLLTHFIAHLARVLPRRENLLELYLDTGDRLVTDLILLATGFEQQRPGGTLLDRLIEQNNLPCAPCGFPIVNQQLCWRKNLFVTGPLAELELGPPARNILGARHTAERLIAVD